MPKLKTKSSAKKRFSFTATGKLRKNYAGKNHFMRRRSQKVIRNTRGTSLVSSADVRTIKKFLPYG